MLFFGILLIYPFKAIAVSVAVYLLLLPISFFHYLKNKRNNKDEITNEDDDLEDVL